MRRKPLKSRSERAAYRFLTGELTLSWSFCRDVSQYRIENKTFRLPRTNVARDTSVEIDGPFVTVPNDGLNTGKLQYAADRSVDGNHRARLSESGYQCANPASLFARIIARNLPIDGLPPIRSIHRFTAISAISCTKGFRDAESIVGYLKVR